MKIYFKILLLIYNYKIYLLNSNSIYDNKINSLNSNSIYDNKINSLNSSSIYDKIDIIYYINLDHRTDRNNDFLNEMNKVNFPSNKIKRISAIKNNNGVLGCSNSHIKTLKDFVSSSHNICIIFEDDFEFIVTEETFKNQLQNIFNNNIIFDVICLSANINSLKNTEYDFLKKIIDAQTTSGYIITKSFAINYLLENFIIGKYLLENNPILEYKYAIDQYWKLLQPSSNWYLFHPKIGKQKESYSDIRKQIVNNKLFSNNNNLFGNINHSILNNNISYNIYTFWTGGNEIAQNIKDALVNLQSISGCNIILITHHNLKNYIKVPLHPVYNYLSETHKSDYLRIYFMNFIGGGYSDIKKTSGSWVKSFNDLYNSNYWIYDYKEINSSVVYSPLSDKWNELVYICKPQTLLTIEWYNEMISFLDSKLELLKKKLSKTYQDCKELDNGYLIEWNKMLGRIFHKIIYKYKDKILNTLPISNFINYK